MRSKLIVAGLLLPLMLPAISWRSADVAEAPEAPRKTLTLSFAGDIMAHSVNFQMPDYDRIYDAVRGALTTDDASFANLEFPLDESAPYSTYPRFNVHAAYVEAAIRGGFDVFSLANNHSTDRFAGGVLKTIDATNTLSETHGVLFSGLRRSGDAPWSLVTFERGGLRVGFVAFTQFLNDPWNGAELVYLADYRILAAGSALLRAVANWDTECDLLIVSYHAGIEYIVEPNPEKARFLRDMVRAGADIVWAHHPHVLQPWELLPGPDGGDKLVLYSLGNFVSGQPWRLSAAEYRRRRAYTGESAVVRVVVDVDERRATILDVEPLLIATVKDLIDGPVIRTLPGVADDHPEADWQRYYYMRHRAMEPFLTGSAPIRY